MVTTVNTMFYGASACNGDVAIVEALLRAPGIDVNKAEGWTALSSAAREGHLPIVEALLRAPGIDVNRGTNFGTPLKLAAEHGHQPVLQALLSACGARRTPTASAV